MKNISFAMTLEQFRNRSKDVTRRVGWASLKPGDVIRGVEKGMGLKRQERIKPLGLIEIVSVREEPLNAITQDDVRREGFPDLTPGEFVDMFACAFRIEPDALVNRIEYKYQR